MQIFPRHELLKGLLSNYIILILVYDTTNAIRVQGKLPDFSLMSALFKMFLQPHLKKNSEPTFRTLKETAVEKAIRQKVQQLTPFLQDNDLDIPEVDNRFTFEGNDETTIIEFIPQKDEAKGILSLRDDNTFKTNMQRYRRIRNKIRMALEKELVSERTKRLVMKTLDELISKMIETQCDWNGGANFGTQTNNDRIIIPRTILKEWSEVWHNLKTKFSSLTNPRASDPLNNLDSLTSYLNSMNVIINDVSNNLEKFSKRYRVRCSVYEKNNVQNAKVSQALRYLKLADDINDSKNACNHIKVCSEELKNFLVEFYNSLNDTAVNVLRNYGEMFTRDVNTDASNEKETIVSNIFNSADVVEKEISDIFVNDTLQLNLDENKNKRANINLLSEYIRHVTKHVKHKFGDIMEIQLRDAPKKAYLTIQEDVIVNLDVDLGNLETDMISKICLTFNACNGNSKRKRFNDIGNTVPGNENKMYVKVELTLDDELAALLPQKPPSLQSNYSPYNVKITRRVATRFFNYDKYANITVTRTTRI